MKAGAKKLFIGMFGGIVLLTGVTLLVLPGPAFLVIPLGLAILATEFAWAQRMKDRFKSHFEAVREKYRKRKRVQAF